MQLCIFEDDTIDDLKPLTLTRAVYDLRLAHRTLLDRLTAVFDSSSLTLHVRGELARLTSLRYSQAAVNRLSRDAQGTLFVNGRYTALNRDTVNRIRAAADTGSNGTVFLNGDAVVAAWRPASNHRPLPDHPLDQSFFDDLEERPAPDARLVARLWEFIDLLPETLTAEGNQVLERNGAQSPDGRLRDRGVILKEAERIFCHASAEIKPGVVLNAEYGPIVIDENAVVSERALIRGPAYVGPYCEITPAARLDCSAFGPHSHIGGEVERSIVHSCSNKEHDGYLGYSYLGQWCNLAADTNTSTLKNDYSTSSLYNYSIRGFEPTGQEYLGLFMGDHSKCGINTMFNPGSSVGVFCNLFGAGYMPRFIPSFSWGGSTQFSPYGIDKALEVAEATLAHRDQSLSPVERDLLRRIHGNVHGGGAEGN